MPTFRARRAYRPRAFALGLLWLVASVGAAFALGVRGGRLHEPVAWPIYVGGAGFFVALIAMMVPRAVTLEVGGGRLVPSWRRAIELDGAELELGTWVLGALDTAIGVVLHVRRRGQRVRIGGEKHAGDGYSLDGPPSRTVDCQLPAADFDALCAALGVRRGAAGPLVVPLTASSQTAGGVAAMMAPWLLTIALISALGAGLALSGLGDRLTRSRHGMYVMTGVTMALIVGGLVLTIARSTRVRRPSLALHADPHGLRLVGKAGDEVAYAPWSMVRATPRMYRITGRGSHTELPALELVLGDHPLAIAAWDPEQAWPAGAERIRRAPGLLAGAPQWSRLCDELRRHRCLAGVTSAR